VAARQPARVSGRRRAAAAAARASARRRGCATLGRVAPVPRAHGAAPAPSCRVPPRAGPSPPRRRLTAPPGPPRPPPGAPRRGRPPPPPARPPLPSPPRSNYGFDPLGLAKDSASLQRFTESEVIHGRWAMLGVAGSLAVELLGFGNWYDAPLWVSGVERRARWSRGRTGPADCLRRRFEPRCPHMGPASPAQGAGARLSPDRTRPSSPLTPPAPPHPGHQRRQGHLVRHRGALRP
jgi:hypothetical protein